jgi:hypothetical protein
MMLSLAFIPVAVIAAGVTAYDAVLRRRISGPACSESSAGGVAAQRRFGVAACAAGAAAGFLLPTILVWAAAGLNMSAVWLLNFRNHAGFYAQFPRTWWKWLLVNPVEFAVAAGAPLAVLTIWSLVRQWKTLRWEVAGQFCVVPATWLLLLVSGKNMGEAARLWIFMMPCLIWLAAPLFESKPDARGDAPTGLASRGAWAVSLALQLLVSTVLVLRMGGFHYDETADPTQAEHPAKAFAPPRLASSANPVLPAKAAALSAVDLRSR